MNAHRPLPWKLFCAEMIGTALLVAIGLSIVILAFGRGSPVLRWLPSDGVRRALAGFLFGTTGALIALSPFGKVSGAHINPAVTLAFWLMGRLKTPHAVGYGVAQLAGAVLGALPLLAWGAMGKSISYGATVPSVAYGDGWALLGEAAATFALVFGLFSILRHRPLRIFAPALFPPLYAVMVWLEAPVSGTSTNPARSFGPAVIAAEWQGWWIYWLGPLLGTLCAVAVYRWIGWHRSHIEVAKVHHFGHDPYGVFHIRMQ